MKTEETALKDDVEVRSAEEVAEAIAALSPDKMVRLTKVSHKYAWLYRPGPEALLWEAIGRAVNGTRKCPVHVDVVKFLAEAMCSIANGEANKIENKAAHTRFDEADALDAIGFSPPNPEEIMISFEQPAAIRSAILELFADDPQARDMADGTMEGYEGEELRSLTDLDKTAFNSKRRLIRRRIKKAYPNGMKNYERR